jgi:hypothetical protein
MMFLPGGVSATFRLADRGGCNRRSTWASVGRVIARARSVDDTWNRET